MKNSKQLLNSLLMLFSVSLFIVACNKGNQQPTAPDPNDELKKIVLNLKGEPAHFSQTYNTPIRSFLADAEGNEVMPGKFKILGCSNDPADNYVQQYPLEVTTNIVCHQGYQVVVSYVMSTNFTPQMANSSSVASFGRVKLTNASNVIVWPTAVPAPKFNVISIQNLGADGVSPNDGQPLTKYKITYKTDYIPASVYDNAAKLETSLFLYTNCEDMSNYPIGYVQQQAVLFNGAIDQSPCNRVDKVYWTQNPGAGTVVSGCNSVPSTCYPVGYVKPDQQELQISTSAGWQPARLWKWSGLPAPNNKTWALNGVLDSYDTYFIGLTGYLPGGTTTLPTGNTQVRYRNKQVSTYGGPCVSNMWVYETWPLIN